MTKINLRTQTQSVLRRQNGGTDNTVGAAHEWLLVPMLNDSGGTLPVGTVVTRTAADPKLHKAATAGEKIVGVVVGRYSTTTGLLDEATCAATETAAVCVAGRANVLTASAAVRGDFLAASTTAGQAAPSASVLSGAFGFVLYQLDSGTAQALIGASTSSSGGVTDHGALTGLADDDHSAYVTVIAGGGETVSVIAATGSTETVAPNTANIHDLTLTADCTITLTAPVPGVGCGLTLIMRQDGTGNRHVTWPGSLVWAGGTAPTLSTGANDVDIITVFTIDAGATWFGSIVGTNIVVSALDDLTDVTITSPETGSRLRYDGSAWVDSMSFPEILIVDVPSTPLIFADLVQNETQDDLLYGDP